MSEIKIKPTYTSANHSLYINPIGEEYDPVETPEGEEQIYTKFEQCNVYAMYIGTLDDTTVSTHAFLHYFANAEYTDILHLHIGSNGGSLNEGVMLINSIIRNFKEENISTICDANAYSMGALMFCIGHRRCITDTTRVMIHNYSCGTSGKGNNIHNMLDSSTELYTMLMKRYFLDTGYVSESELNDVKNGKDMWLNSEELCRRGMATHVGVGVDTYTADKYLKMLDDEDERKAKATKSIKLINETYKPGTIRHSAATFLHYSIKNGAGNGIKPLLRFVKDNGINITQPQFKAMLNKLISLGIYTYDKESDEYSLI